MCSGITVRDGYGLCTIVWFSKRGTESKTKGNQKQASKQANKQAMNNSMNRYNE
jgi:hypothetical protein